MERKRKRERKRFYCLVDVDVSCELSHSMSSNVHKWTRGNQEAQVATGEKRKKKEKDAKSQWRLSGKKVREDKGKKAKGKK